MKPTAIFCNTARAGLVDQQALCEALQSKKIRGAVLDVFWDEPVPKDSPFLKMNNVTMTPHRAGVTTDIVPNTYNLMIQDLAPLLGGRASEVPGQRISRNRDSRWQAHPAAPGRSSICRHFRFRIIKTTSR